MITGTLAPPARPAVWDIAMDYKEDEGRFYARSDIDHRVLIEDGYSVWANVETGEFKIERSNWRP